MLIIPCNPFSLIFLFHNPFNASNLRGGEWQGQWGKPELWCGAGAGRAWLCDARASLCFPPMASPEGSIPNWGQLTGQHRRGEFSCGENRVGGQ